MYKTEPDKGYAWIVMVASFGEHVIMGYFMYASGMIHIALSEKFESGVLATTWITSLFLALISLSGPIASIIINKYSCRIAMVTGSLMLTFGLIITSYITDFVLTYFSFGILSGTGLGICYNTGIIVLAFNFEKKRNIACGIAISGGGIGPFILTPLYEIIYESFGYNGYFLLLAGLALQNCVFGAVLRDSKIEANVRKAHQNKQLTLSQSITSYGEIVKNLAMLCLCFSYFLSSVSIYMVYIHFPKYCLQNDSTKMEVSIFLSLAGICSCIGRILFGMTTNTYNIDELVMLFGVFSILGLATVLFPLIVFSLYGKIMYACILGTYSGCCWTVVNTLVMQIFGQERFAHGIGYLMLYVGIGNLLGPPTAGFIINFGGTYGHSFVVAGILLFCAAFLALFTMSSDSNGKDKSTRNNFELDIKMQEKEAMLRYEEKSANILNGEQKL